MRNGRSETGAALLEAAITIPILLLVTVGIFEFGRAYQTWQVLTNAAREGARVAVLPDLTGRVVQQRVRDYMQAGQLARYGTRSRHRRTAPRPSTVNGAAVSASQVTVDYPFKFIVLQPVARLDRSSPRPRSACCRRDATPQAVMRNETQ